MLAEKKILNIIQNSVNIICHINSKATRAPCMKDRLLRSVT